MRLPKFEYLEPKSLKEAAKALALDTKGSALLAGGTDLLVNMKHRVIQPKKVINPSFLDYGIPTAMEVPPIACVEVETNDPEGPFGAKESGEGTQLAPAPAIINAIYDAIGVRFNSLPVTPEKVLEALWKK